MYQMKKIISYDDEIVLPKCMYYVRNHNERLTNETNEYNLNISNQLPNSKMAELEQRQEILLKKLDFLYERIKSISSYCGPNADISVNLKSKNTKSSNVNLEEAVLAVHPDNLPYYLAMILKDTAVNLSWHIHSSVPNEKVPKIKGFVKSLKSSDSKSKINLRLIFQSVSVDSELKLSSLMLAIVGTVNIMRYLSYVYPLAIPYDDQDFNMDSLLDICHLLEKSSEKTKETLVKKLFTNSKDWIYNNQYSVVDLAAYNVVKQSKSLIKLAPKTWFNNCEKKAV